MVHCRPPYPPIYPLPLLAVPLPEHQPQWGVLLQLALSLEVWLEALLWPSLLSLGFFSSADAINMSHRKRSWYPPPSPLTILLYIRQASHRIPHYRLVDPILQRRRQRKWEFPWRRDKYINSLQQTYGPFPFSNLWLWLTLHLLPQYLLRHQAGRASKDCCLPLPYRIMTSGQVLYHTRTVASGCPLVLLERAQGTYLLYTLLTEFFNGVLPLHCVDIHSVLIYPVVLCSC